MTAQGAISSHQPPSEYRLACAKRCDVLRHSRFDLAGRSGVDADIAAPVVTTPEWNTYGRQRAIVRRYKETADLSGQLTAF
jgi:hypothetical protein